MVNTNLKMLFKLKEKRAKLKEKRAKLKEQGVIARPTNQQLATNFNIMIAQLQKLIFAGVLNHKSKDLVNIENVYYTIVHLENQFVVAFNADNTGVNVANTFRKLFQELTKHVTLSHLQNKLRHIATLGMNLVVAMGSPPLPPVTQLPIVTPPQPTGF